VLLVSAGDEGECEQVDGSEEEVLTDTDMSSRGGNKVEAVLVLSCITVGGARLRARLVLLFKEEEDDEQAPVAVVVVMVGEE
jgi:hypothetical protein